MDASVLFLLVAILFVGILVFLAINLTGQKNYKFDVEEFQTSLLRIENSLTKDNRASYNSSVIEADKLLDKALIDMGTPGKTMGERLKHAGSKFSQLNSVWYAHKLRNQIAHEHGFNLEYNQSRHALNTFRQALRDLGAI